MADNIQIITASQIINFDRDDDADQGILRIEVDNRNDGLNAGKTSFQPGDSVGLLLYVSPNVTILEGPIVTAGSIAVEGGLIPVEQQGFIAFAGDYIQNMSYPICNPSLQWLGNDLGALRVNHCATVELLNPPDWNPGAPNANLASKIGIIKYEGTASAQGYRLTDTNLVAGAVDVPYQIGVYVFGAANLPQ